MLTIGLLQVVVGGRSLRDVHLEFESDSEKDEGTVT